MRTVKTRTVITFILALLTFQATGHGQPGAGVINKLMTDFTGAFNAKDAAKLASLYAEDAVLMPPNAPLIKGRAAIEAALRRMVERGGTLTLSPMTSETNGNSAFSAGTYTVTVLTGSSLTLTGVGGSGTQTFAAKYLTVFKRAGNDWRIAYDMQNADQPGP
jgi:uncharacterized protein (TIGR02246 family)